MMKLISLRNLCEFNKPFVSILNQQSARVAVKQYCSNDNGKRNRNANTEPKIEAVTLSYSSYENTNATTTAAPIIIMHGLFGSKMNWRSISKALQAKSSPARKVYAVDARNHGESPHSPNHRYEDLAEDVREFYRQHNIDKAIVVGHSMGGRTMMAFALTYPKLVEKAIIIDVSPVTTSPALKNMGAIFAAMHGVRLEKGLSPSDGRASADEQIKPIIADKVTRDFILMNLYRADDGRFKWRANVNALHTNFTKYISRFPDSLLNRQYNAPTLFIGGSKSDYLNAPDELDKIRDIFLAAQLVFLDCGHLVHVEKPHELLQLVFNYKWRVNVNVLEEHRPNLIQFPDYLRENRFDGPILFFGGTRSTQLHVDQIPEITRTFRSADVRFLDGGHDIGIAESRHEFLQQAGSFINEAK